MEQQGMNKMISSLLDSGQDFSYQQWNGAGSGDQKGNLTDLLARLDPTVVQALYSALASHAAGATSNVPSTAGYRDSMAAQSQALKNTKNPNLPANRTAEAQAKSAEQQVRQLMQKSASSSGIDLRDTERNRTQTREDRDYETESRATDLAAKKQSIEQIREEMQLAKDTLASQTSAEQERLAQERQRLQAEMRALDAEERARKTEEARKSKNQEYLRNFLDNFF